MNESKINTNSSKILNERKIDTRYFMTWSNILYLKVTKCYFVGHILSKPTENYQMLYFLGFATSIYFLLTSVPCIRRARKKHLTRTRYHVGQHLREEK